MHQAGIYANRLHKGDSPIESYYFDQEVLQRYFNHPEQYSIEDGMTGGSILTKDEYYFSLPEESRDIKTFAQIRYGKRRLKDGSIVVTVIAIDLARLPYKEQQYWTSYEIKNPQFAEKDEAFEAYFRSQFLAEFVSYEDPLYQIYGIVKDINDIFIRLEGAKLFKNDRENPYLRYPITNTLKAYQEAHKELFKLIGSDALDKDVLFRLLKNRLGIKEKVLKNSEGKIKGSWALLKVLIEKTPGATFDPLKECQEARVKDAHIIEKARLPNMDFRQKFQDDCRRILGTLSRLKLFLYIIKQGINHATEGNPEI